MNHNQSCGSPSGVFCPGVYRDMGRMECECFCFRYGRPPNPDVLVHELGFKRHTWFQKQTWVLDLVSKDRLGFRYQT